MIYMIQTNSIDDDFSYISYIYEDITKAEHHKKLLTELEGDYPSYYYTVIEKEFNDSNLSLDSKVVPYYSYSIELDDSDTDPEEYNDEDTELRIYDGDLVEVEKDDYLTWYSVNSYQEAREHALQYFMDHFQ